MDATFLSTLSGTVLRLALSYVPSLKDWYGGLDPQGKAITMLAVLAITAVGLFAASCTGLYVTVACDQAGALELGKMFFAALIANQSTYLVTRRL